MRRRDFLNLIGSGAGMIGLSGCGTSWSVPDQLVEMALRGPGLEREVLSICGLCGAGCGMTVRLVDSLPVGVKGNPNHPISRGGLCPVGKSALELLYHPDRIQQPLSRTAAEGDLQPTSWEEALSRISDRLLEVRSQGRSDRIVFLNGEYSGLFGDLLRQFAYALGSPNVSGASDLRVLPFQLSQGLDEIPGFDLSGADTVLSVGLDIFEDGPAPVHAIAAMIGGRPNGERCSLLYAGTRLSTSAAKADQFVLIRPGTHAAFALGIAHVLVREGHYDRQFVAEHTFGFEDWDEEGEQRPGLRQLLLENFYPDRVAQICGCAPERIVDIARRFAQSSSPVAIAGGEAVRSSNATWNVLAVHALNALVGAFDRPGGVFPRAQIPLAPLPDVTSPPSGSIFSTSGLTGQDPILALTNHILDDNQIPEILFVINWNPVYESPVGQRFQEALARIPLVVHLAPFLDETAVQAHVVLPTPLFLESWNEVISPPATTPSSLGLSRPVVEPFYSSRHAGDTLLALKQSVFSPEDAALPWARYEDYLKYRLGGLGRSGKGSIATGSFEDSWRHFLEERGWRFQEEALLNRFWEELVEQSAWSSPLVYQEGHWDHTFQTPTGRYEFYSLTLQNKLVEMGRADEKMSDGEALTRACKDLGIEVENHRVCLPHFVEPVQLGEGDLTLIPFSPITARGRLGTCSSMVQEMFGFEMLSGWETWAGVSRGTAARLGFEDGDIAAVDSDQGSIEIVVRILPGASPDSVHVPIGLGRRGTGRQAHSSGSNPLAILTPAMDVLDGSLSLTSTRVRLRLIRRRPHGGPAPSHEGGHV